MCWNLLTDEQTYELGTDIRRSANTRPTGRVVADRNTSCQSCWCWSGVTRPCPGFETVEERAGLDKVRGGEPLGEVSIHGAEHVLRLAQPAVVRLKPGEAGRSAQFPGQGSLGFRLPDRDAEMTFGDHAGVGGALHQQEFALQAMQLRQAPMLSAGL